MYGMSDQAADRGRPRARPDAARHVLHRAGGAERRRLGIVDEVGPVADRPVVAYRRDDRHARRRGRRGSPAPSIITCCACTRSTGPCARRRARRSVESLAQSRSFLMTLRTTGMSGARFWNVVTRMPSYVVRRTSRPRLRDLDLHDFDMVAAHAADRARAPTCSSHCHRRSAGTSRSRSAGAAERSSGYQRAQPGVEPGAVGLPAEVADHTSPGGGARVARRTAGSASATRARSSARGSAGSYSRPSRSCSTSRARRGSAGATTGSPAAMYSKTLSGDQ